jgi:hypothetical protein
VVRRIDEHWVGVWHGEAGRKTAKYATGEIVTSRNLLRLTHASYRERITEAASGPAEVKLDLIPLDDADRGTGLVILEWDLYDATTHEQTSRRAEVKVEWSPLMAEPDAVTRWAQELHRPRPG